MSENNKYKVSPECLSNMEKVISDAVDEVALSTLDTLGEKIKEITQIKGIGNPFILYNDIVWIIEKMRQDIKQSKEG